MAHTSTDAQFFGQEKIWKILLRIAPPVMLAQLIQALYNIVDSLFVGRYAESGLTALSIVYPIQLLMMALAIGTGVGINTAMAARFGVGKQETAQEFAGIGTPLAGILWILFAAVTFLLMPAYAGLSSSSPEVVKEVVTYGRIVCVFSFGLFFESIWTKILQAQGDMKTPMVAQILGGGHQYRAGPASDLWNVRPASNGDCGCGSGHCNGAGGRRPGCDEKGIPEISRQSRLCAAGGGDLSPGYPQHSGAVRLYVLHLRTQFDLVRLL